MGYPHLVLNAWIELVEDRDWVLSFQLHPVVQVAAGARVAPLRRRPVDKVTMMMIKTGVTQLWRWGNYLDPTVRVIRNILLRERLALR